MSGGVAKNNLLLLLAVAACSSRTIQGDGGQNDDGLDRDDHQELCEALAGNLDECNLGLGAYARMYCLDALGEDQAQGCETALEDFFACLSSASCEAMQRGTCAPEEDDVERECV
jgi:hypothetical protein